MRVCALAVTEDEARAGSRLLRLALHSDHLHRLVAQGLGDARPSAAFRLAEKLEAILLTESLPAEPLNAHAHQALDARD